MCFTSKYGEAAQVKYWYGGFMQNKIPRTDTHTASLLREGLAMKRAFGDATGARFLSLRGVDAGLAARVLAQKYDQRG